MPAGTRNVHDPYAVAVVNEGVTVGHVPRAISSVCSSFLRRNGMLTCEVTGTRQYSADLPQGGLEISCSFLVKLLGEAKLITKIRNLLQEAVTSGLFTTKGKPQQNNPPDSKSDSPDSKSDSEQPKKKRRTEQSCSKTWVQFNGMVLSQLDKEQLFNGSWLSDRHINYAQSLLKKQFPHIDGWKDTLLVHKKQKKIKQGVQIIHSYGNHWIVASTLGCREDEIKIFVRSIHL